MSVNVPPPSAAFAVWVFREVVALAFVIGWLSWVGIDIWRGTEHVPFWANIVGVWAFGYALGVSAPDLSAFRPTLPSAHPAPPPPPPPDKEGVSL